MFLAIDPGQAKCGWALFDADAPAAHGIWKRSEFASNLARLAAKVPLDLLVLGDGTGHRELLAELKASDSWRDRVRLVPEEHSSEEARLMYVREHTRGWRRLIPVTLRYPDRPYDDYVAVILGRRFLKGGAGNASAPR